MLTLGLGPSMIARGGGSVINISSTASLRGPLGRVAYSWHQGRGRRHDTGLGGGLGSSGIRMNALCPGLISTAIWEADHRDRPELTAQLEERISPKRWGESADVADVVVFFASDASRYVTGEVVAVDGGLARVSSAPRSGN